MLRELEHAYERASCEHDDAALAQLQRDEASARAEAVHALRRLDEGEARKRLVAYQAFLDGARTDTVRMDYCDRLLDSSAPHWWVSAFTDLFFCGDFMGQRGLPLRRWRRALLRRAAFAGWPASEEFAAAGYNICVRRAWMCEVASYVRTSKEFRVPTPDLLELSPRDIVVAALAAGEATSIRHALQRSNVDVRVEKVLRSMEVALRRVRGIRGRARRAAFQVQRPAPVDGLQPSSLHVGPPRRSQSSARSLHGGREEYIERVSSD